MSSSRLIVVISAILSCGLCGCAPSRRPSPAQVDDFINRRAFVISAVNDLKEPMPGTSYSRHSESLASGSEDRIKRGLEVSGFPIRGLRQEIERHGLGFLPPNMGLEFDVDLSDQLMKDATPGAIAKQLNHHYARKLEEAGWYVSGAGTGATSPDVLFCTYLWTDSGKGSHTYSGNAMSLQSTIRDPDDFRRGSFYVLIAVRVDTDARRAHITINYWGRIG